MVRVDGIEPTTPAWKAGVLPLNYTRKVRNHAHPHSASASSKEFILRVNLRRADALP